MKLKTTLFASLMTILLAVSLVSALIYAPLPIDGKINGVDLPAGLIIRITNLRTGITVDTVVDGSGYYLYDWANSPDNNGLIVKYQAGDQFQVSLPICSSSPLCSQSATYLSTMPEIFMTFNLNSVGITQTTTVSTTTTTTTPNCPATDYTAWSVTLVAAITIIFAGLIKKYAPYGGKTKIETYTKKDKSIGYRFYSYEAYTTSTGKASHHWVKKKEW